MRDFKQIAHGFFVRTFKQGWLVTGRWRSIAPQGAQKRLPGYFARQPLLRLGLLRGCFVTQRHRSLGDLERAGDGGSLIVAAQRDHRHHIAARLGGGCGGAGINLPLAG